MRQEESKHWCTLLAKKLKEAFGETLYFLGLQGSYRRGEATPDSDIDVVVVFTHINVKILSEYQAVLRTMPHWEKACGFVCGETELFHWPAYDMLQLFYDTQPVYGTLDAVKGRITNESIAEAAMIGAANLYHAACHHRIFQSCPAQHLAALYKEGMFLLRTYALYTTGIFARTHKQLGELLTGQAKQMYDQWSRQGEAAQRSLEETDLQYQNIIKFCQNILNDINY